MERVSFAVPGQPVGKQRARTVVRGGRVMSYTPAETRSYERKLWLAARAVVGFHHKPWTGPVRITVRAFMGDARRRDLDNAVKSVMDALNRRIFADDSQVAEIHSYKALDRAHPRVEVELEHLVESAQARLTEGMP